MTIVYGRCIIEIVNHVLFRSDLILRKDKYKEVIQVYDERETFILKGLRGTKIYKERRENHLKGMTVIRKGVEYPLTEYDYLVFEIEGEVDFSKIKDKHYDHFVFSYKVNKINKVTEISSHHPFVFHSLLLIRLEELGYIKKTWKTTEDGKYNMYVNARGLQIVNNLFVLGWIFNIKLLKKLLKKIRGK